MASSSGNTGSVLDEYNQCIFIRYYTVRKRLGILKVMKAAAGPHDLGGGGRDGDGPPIEARYDSDQDSDSGAESDTVSMRSSTAESDITVPNAAVVRYFFARPPLLVHSVDTLQDGRDDFDVIANHVFQVNWERSANTSLIHRFQNPDAQSVLLHHEDIPLLHEVRRIAAGNPTFSTLHAVWRGYRLVYAGV